MTITAIATPDEQPDDLEKLSTDDLKERFLAALQMTANSLIEMARIVKILDKRGEDLSDMKLGIISLLRKIAYGQVLPELVAKYSGNANLIRYASSLAIPDQQRIVSGEPLRVMLLTDGGTDARHVDPHKLSTREIQQVFASDHIRDEGEQISYLRSRTPRGPIADPDDVRIDAKRKGVSIAGRFFTRSELAALLARIPD